MPIVSSDFLKGHMKLIHSVSWVPSGELLASVSKDSIRVCTFRCRSEALGALEHKCEQDNCTCRSRRIHRIIGCIHSFRLRWKLRQTPQTMEVSCCFRGASEKSFTWGKL